MKFDNQINQWMTPKQITELPGMPGTIQGVHKRARKEGWPKRPKEGRSGPGVEYLLSSERHEVVQDKQSASSSDTLKMFSMLIDKLSQADVIEIEKNMAKHGLSGLINESSVPTTEEALKMLGINRQVLQTALSLHALSSEARREILSKYGISEQAGPVAPKQEPHKEKKVG